MPEKSESAQSSGLFTSLAPKHVEEVTPRFVSPSKCPGRPAGWHFRVRLRRALGFNRDGRPVPPQGPSRQVGTRRVRLCQIPPWWQSRQIGGVVTEGLPLLSRSWPMISTPSGRISGGCSSRMKIFDHGVGIKSLPAGLVDCSRLQLSSLGDEGGALGGAFFSLRVIITNEMRVSSVPIPLLGERNVFS